MSPSQSQCAAPEVGSDLEGITFGPVEADEACWRDDEIKLGEKEGRKVAADLCHMLLSREAIAPEQDLSLPVQKGRHLRSGEQRSEPQGHLNTGLLAS